MAVPKRKVSKMRSRQRKSAHPVCVAVSKPCPQCGSLHRPHRVCPDCGYYGGRQVLTVATA